MVVAYDNWERLVRATLLREELRQIARQCSTTSSISSEFSHGFHSIFLNFSKIRKPFEYEQIHKATDGFADKNLIKCGHSGDLFLGKLDSSTSVVIKRTDLLLVSPSEYFSELEFYSKVAHSGFVRLLGHCFEDEDIKFLVYEYVPNGDLSSFSFTKPNGDISLKLWSWRTRMKIAIGAAESLAYLHHECKPPLVHGEPKWSLQRRKHSPRQEYHVIDCNCCNTKHFNSVSEDISTRDFWIYEEDTSGRSIGSRESDVYCFGKVLLELVTGKLGISAKSDVMAQDWLQVMLHHIEDYKTSIIDPSLLISNVSEFDNLWAVAGLAKSCLDPVPSSRPQMKSVLKDLEDLNNSRTYHK